MQEYQDHDSSAAACDILSTNLCHGLVAFLFFRDARYRDLTLFVRTMKGLRNIAKSKSDLRIRFCTHW